MFQPTMHLSRQHWQGRQLFEMEEVNRPRQWPVQLLASSMFDGQCLEAIERQQDSILFQIPGEIRQKIYKFVFTADEFPRDATVQFAYETSWQHKVRVCTTFLLTCRAVYAEAWPLPVAMNPIWTFEGTNWSQPGVMCFSLRASIRSLPDHLGAAHFAALSSLVINTQQAFLESSDDHLTRYSKLLAAKERHTGLLVAEHDPPLAPDANGPRRDPHDRYMMYTEASLDDSWAAFTASRTKDITQLTIRLDRSDWWTWGNDPQPQEGDRGLALDPALGDGGAVRRPLVSRMLRLAEDRKARQDRGEQPVPYPPNCWGARVALFPGLRRLTLHLETFAWRVAELDRIIECAKTWTFPLDNNSASDGRPGEVQAGRVLKWDGEVEAYRWGQQYRPPREWHVSSAVPHGLETRIISFAL
jgi:hypothetical protein